MNREILRIALPSIITNITVPLLGLVDLAIVGRIGSASGIGAISVGTMIFNMVYWIFNFLRFGSSGLTAQAFGKKDSAGIQKVFRLATTVALACGLLVIILQRPIEWLSGWIISPSDEVWGLAIEYFRIRVWAAPAVIMLFALNGWFVGMQNSRIPMYIAIGQNIVNIIASYILVFNYNMGIAGVAIGTVVSQYVGLTAAIILTPTLSLKGEGDNIDSCRVTKTYIHNFRQIILSFKAPSPFKERAGVRLFFSVNRDIFLRMIFMLAVTCAFTSIGARMGDDFLAVNTLLMQLFILFSYFSDGFALAGEALVGKYVGKVHSAQFIVHSDDNKDNYELCTMNYALKHCIKLLFAWAGGVTIIFTLAYVFGINGILKLLTSDMNVVEFAAPYVGWAMLIPVASFAAFAWDGIYIGATATREMLYSLALAATVFFGVYFVGIHIINIYIGGMDIANHILWFAFIAYLFTRSLAQTIMARKLDKFDD